MHPNGASGVSIGNYKGVMLCNRPFAGVTAAAHAAGRSDGKQPFLSTVATRDPVGFNPARVVRDMPHRSKKNSALSRHKRWLYDLKKAKERLQEEAEQEEARKELKRQRFAEQQAALRAEVRNTL